MNPRILLRIFLAAAALLPLGGCLFQTGEGDGNALTTFSIPRFPGSGNESARSGQTASDGTLLELPAFSAGDRIIRHGGFVLSYDAARKLPKWVAYELTAEETDGDAERDELIFKMDPSYNETQAMREDYYDSGWTKGHMACAADFKWDSDAMEETFYLTNICPQDEELNKGDWNYLERQVRAWARRYGRVWVVCGPIVNKNRYGTIGERRVVVPDGFFKAVLVPGEKEFRSIAFVMGNDDKLYFLDKCSMSVNELEQYLGYDFYPALPDDVEETVEAQYRPADWGIRVK